MHSLRKAWDALGSHAPDADPTPAAEIEKPPAIWHYSSFELMNGLDVAEYPGERAGDALDALFRPWRCGRRTAT